MKKQQNIETIAKIIGANVKHFKNSKKIKLADLSQKSGCGENHIGDIERGNKNITLETIVKLAKGLSVPPACLLINTDSEISNALISEILEKLMTSDEETLEYLNKVMSAAIEFAANKIKK